MPTLRFVCMCVVWTWLACCRYSTWPWLSKAIHFRKGWKPEVQARSRVAADAAPVIMIEPPVHLTGEVQVQPAGCGARGVWEVGVMVCLMQVALVCRQGGCVSECMHPLHLP